MNQVAREANLAKGTLYLYFDTKEELFLALLFNHLQAWFAKIHQLLGERPLHTPDDIADVFIQSAQDCTSLRRLLLLSNVLERNVQTESLRHFHLGLRANVQTIIKQLPWSPEQTLQLLAHIHALSVGWHQVAENKVKIRALEAQGLVPAYHMPSFEASFAFAVKAIVKDLSRAPLPI